MSEAILGEIRIFAGNFPPRDFAFCHGQLLPITQFTALFAILSNTYGGNGRTTFALPDLQGRIPVHPDGQTIQLGTKLGRETTLIEHHQLPSHTHQLNANPGRAQSHSPRLPARPDEDIYLSTDGLSNEELAMVEMGNSRISYAGGDQPYNSMPPYLPLNFIICLNGIFPERG